METRNKGNKKTLTPISRKVNNDITSVDQLPDELRALYMLISSKFDQSLHELERKIDVRDEKIFELESGIHLLKKENLSLQQRLEDVECRERGDAVILSGTGVPDATPHENVVNVASLTVKNLLKCEVRPEDIIEATRIGKRPQSQAPDRRNILLKLRSKDMRNDLLLSAKKVKPSGFYVNEHLTPTRAKILYGLRQVRRSHPEKVSSCNSVNGRICVYLRSMSPAGKDQRYFVNSMTELEEFVEKHFGKKIDDIINANQNETNRRI